MNRELLEKAGINYEEGLRRFMGKTELYEKFLAKFNDDTNYSDMLHAIKEKRYEDAFKFAHAFKGVTGNLSMDDLFNKVQPLVEALRHNETDHLNALVSPVKKEYVRVTKALSK